MFDIFFFFLFKNNVQKFLILIGYFCRKEILVEKVKYIEIELMKISIESFKNEENVIDDEEEREYLIGIRYN